MRLSPLSYLVATRLKCFNLLNIPSIKLRSLYNLRHILCPQLKRTSPAHLIIRIFDLLLQKIAQDFPMHRTKHVN
jgi:hypothetical protein